MSVYKLEIEEASFDLNSEQCSAFFNDEEQPINGIDEAMIIDLLNESDKVFFQNQVDWLQPHPLFQQ